VHAIVFDAVRVTVVLPVSITRDRNDVLVHFPTIPGKNYRVEVATALGGSSQGWATLMDNVAGTGNISDARHVNAFSQPACFYRVTVLPP
jgi:hypothetical protein